MQIINRCESDLLAIVEIDWPGETTGKTLSEVLPGWITWKVRSISNRKRVVVVGPRVAAKLNEFPAIAEIQRRIEAGQDLKAYLHKPIFTQSSNEFADPLLLDWGIHHFHLGADLGQQSVVRTGDLLFARVTGDRAIFIDVQPHGVWNSEELLRTMIRIAPEDFETNKLKNVVGLSVNYSEAENAQLRKIGGNGIHEVDGNFYAMLGGGISGAKTRVQSLRFADQLSLELNQIVSRMKNGTLPYVTTTLAPHSNEVVVLRARFVGGCIEVFTESHGPVILRSPVIC
jgi:hypothetical protein